MTTADRIKTIREWNARNCLPEVDFLLDLIDKQQKALEIALKFIDDCTEEHLAKAAICTLDKIDEVLKTESATISIPHDGTGYVLDET